MPVGSSLDLVSIHGVELLVNIVLLASVEFKSVVLVGFEALVGLEVLNLVGLLDVLNLVIFVVVLEWLDDGILLWVSRNGEARVGEGSDRLRVVIPQEVLTTGEFLILKLQVELASVHKIPSGDWNWVVSDSLLALSLADESESLIELESTGLNSGL